MFGNIGWGLTDDLERAESWVTEKKPKPTGSTNFDTNLSEAIASAKPCNYSVG